MSKSTPDEKQSPTNKGAIHLVLQGKGGVGKSLVATWLAQYLLARQKEVRCIDSDPVNRSLAQYAALNADKLDLVNGDGVVERSRFDDLLDRFATEEVTFLLDSGATVFLPLWGFIMEIGMIGVLRDVGRQVYVHCVVCGGDMLNDTLMGFETLAKSAPDRNIVLWLNEYFGEISRDGKTFEEMTVFKQNRDKVLGSVAIPQRSPDTFGMTVKRMREKKLTFDEAIQSEAFRLADKSRLYAVRKQVFDQLDTLQMI
jgi:CobQ/CobB/MinD/ParA nucleotide binding domain